MIEYREALRRVLARCQPLPSEIVPLAESMGRILARRMRAAENIPPFDKATMDGYAVRAADTVIPPDSEFVELEVCEDLPAGRISRKGIGPGRAARIMTGAPLPRGADAVVMVEDTARSGSKVRIFRKIGAGDNTGEAGEDVRKGEVILEKGDLVGPAEIGMLAALGRASVPVSRRPKLAVIATGNELVEPGEKAGRGRIRNSNGHSLSAMALQAGADASYLGIAQDRVPSLKAKIRRAAGAHILVLSGGVSVGDYDLVKNQLQELGVLSVFWQVRIKPGKPVFFGVKGRQLVFGLPGNPTSAMVTFLLFVRPAVDKMLGRRESGTRKMSAVIESDLKLKPGRTQFLRGILKGAGPELRVVPFSDQKSGVLKSMVKSTVLIMVPADVTSLEKGQTVEIVTMD